MINKVYIKPEPITFILGLSIWALAVFYLMDLKETIITGIALLLYGYSISYGSESYKAYALYGGKE